MSDEQRDFIDRITNYNIESRYPEDRTELARTLTKQACRYFIDETRKIQQWIEERLQETKLLDSSADTNA